MAFFNLTQLGPQDLFKTASTCRGDSPGAATPQPQAHHERPEARKGDGAVHSSVQPGSRDGSGCDPAPQQRESTGKEVRVTCTGAAPSTSKPHYL